MAKYFLTRRLHFSTYNKNLSLLLLVDDITEVNNIFLESEIGTCISQLLMYNHSFSTWLLEGKELATMDK